VIEEGQKEEASMMSPPHDPTPTALPITLKKTKKRRSDYARGSKAKAEIDGGKTLKREDVSTTGYEAVKVFHDLMKIQHSNSCERECGKGLYALGLRDGLLRKAWISAVMVAHGIEEFIPNETDFTY